jgi:hypothetical protein
LAIELVAVLIDASATPLISRVPPPPEVASSVCPSSVILLVVIDEILCVEVAEPPEPANCHNAVFGAT